MLKRYGNGNREGSIIIVSVYASDRVIIIVNDRIIINDEYIKWYDNKKEGTVLLKNIKSCEISIKNNLIFFATTKLIIHNIDGSRSTIPTYKMNFTKTGVLQASQLLNSLINK